MRRLRQVHRSRVVTPNTLKLIHKASNTVGMELELLKVVSDKEELDSTSHPLPSLHVLQRKYGAV